MLFIEGKVVTDTSKKFKVNYSSNKVYIYVWDKEKEDWKMMMTSPEEFSMVLEVQE